MSRRTPMLGLAGAAGAAILALYWLLDADPATDIPSEATADAVPLSVHPASQPLPLPEGSALPVETASASPDVVQVPTALQDPAVALQGFIGLSLEVGAGKSQTVTLNPTDVLLNKGVMLVAAKARLLGVGLPAVPVTAAQAYVGAPVTISLADALQALGGGDAQTLVGGVPLFLEVTSIDSAGQTHVTRTPFEVTNRDLQADATAVLEPPPLAPALTP